MALKESNLFHLRVWFILIQTLLKTLVWLWNARKRNRKEVLAIYNKTRINISHQHDRWMKLKEALRVQTHAEMAEKLRHKCKHLWVCACSSDIGTCIINDAGRRAAHQNNENTRFLSNLPKRRFILTFWKYILTFNAKTKTFKTITKLTSTIPLNFSIYVQTAEICTQSKIILYIRNTTTYQNILNAMDEILYFWSSFDLNNIYIIIGNSKISRLTLQRNYELRIDLEDFNGNKVYAKYSTFYVGGAATKYKLHVGGYSGTAGKLVLRRLLPYHLRWESGIWWRRYMVTYG